MYPLAYHASPDQSDATPIYILNKKEWDAHVASLDSTTQNWVAQHKKEVQSGEHIVCPAAGQQCQRVLLCSDAKEGLWTLAALPNALPSGNYYLANQPICQKTALGWVLAQYSFDRYLAKKTEASHLLLIDDEATFNAVKIDAYGHNLARDLINIPTNDMGPSHLAESAKKLAEDCGADYSEIIGDDLLTQNYPMVHAVGRAAENKPRLIDIRWGSEAHPKLTLVGKGVCFDTGGLDIKPYSSMKLMKKDMGGAAFTLALSYLIMQHKLPVRLRVLVPAVENSIADNAFRPQDILTARDGTTVEIGSTDAEGRLILADALVEADSESPDLVIDVATLTGAARVAMGTAIPALFSKNSEDAQSLVAESLSMHDPLWQLPLWAEYGENIRSPFADLTNTPIASFGGAIHAALFLQHFIPNTANWMHIDTMAWNLADRPGRPKGGEALGLHALFSWLSKRYAS